MIRTGSTATATASAAIPADHSVGSTPLALIAVQGYGLPALGVTSAPGAGSVLDQLIRRHLSSFLGIRTVRIPGWLVLLPGSAGLSGALCRCDEGA